MKKTVVGFIAVVMLVATALLIRQLKFPRVIVHVNLAEGGEFCMVQRPGDPFSTSAYYRAAGGLWRRYYYDHDDWLWIKGSAEVHATNQLITVYRGGKPTAKFNVQKREFTIVRWNRSTTENDPLPDGQNPWDD